MGNIASVESRKRQEIEDLVKSMLETFESEYITAYSGEILKCSEETPENDFSFSLKFCPWERLECPIKKGYLTKQGVIVKSWRRRYFVVRSNYLIDYYENKETYDKGLKPKRTINPCGYRTVPNIEDEISRKRKSLAKMLDTFAEADVTEKFPDHSFGVVHDKLRNFFIYAESEEEKSEWMDMFDLCCASVKGLDIVDPVEESTFHEAVHKTLTIYGFPDHFKYQGTKEKVIYDIISAKVDAKFMAELCKHVKGLSAKLKVRDQVLKHLDASLMSLVTAMWQKLELNTSKMKSEIELTLYEKQREIDAVRRKVEWEMNGTTRMCLDEALKDTKVRILRMCPVLEKSMFDALCEVRNIYERNIVEIGVDVEQRDEIEIPILRYVHSLDMIARTPSEMASAYQCLDSLKKELTSLQVDINTFDATAMMLRAQDKLRRVMDALVNTFEVKFFEVSNEVEGKLKHKQLRMMIENLDDEIANNMFENNVKEIMYRFNMDTLKTIFIPYVHRNIHEKCTMEVESAEKVIPEHLKVVINTNNEYRVLVERSVEDLIRQVLLKKDDAKQRSFKSSLRQSRRKTFPKFIRRQTKFQDSGSEAGLERRVSYPQTKMA
ncbi:protein Niban 2-like [Xenia sp. Carnegie-2017]|uniref:protein Niban 2-like n=1 Tax=Xenia sp. Carnegie-2017 TaxID=2897299 RepID=UPI001F0438F0|nr:protein Niban 2-like [Xenia sp. Carnegie-2017]